MGGFLGEVLSLPTVIYTALLCVALTYWFIQIVLGTFDSHALDGHAGDAAHVDLGHADVSHVDVPDVGHADVADAAHGHGDAGHADAGHGHAHEVFDLLSALGLRGVPLTFSLSMVVLWAWGLCFAGMHLGAPTLVKVLPPWLVGSLVGVLSLVVATPLAALTCRPFRQVFSTHHAPTKMAFIGRACTITSGTVDAKFGTALCEDGGAGLVIAVRYEGSSPVRKGQRAVLVDYDPERDAYTIEPVVDDDPPVAGRDRPRGPREGVM